MTEQTEASHEEGAAIASSAFWEAKQALAKRMAQAPLPAYYRKDEVCRIVEGLFLSSRFAEMDKQLLEGVGITHILQVLKAASDFTFTSIPKCDTGRARKSTPGVALG